MAVVDVVIHSRGYVDGADQLVGIEYTRIEGMMTVAVDPSHAANRGITDLDLVPRSPSGLVEFESGFCLVEPSSRVDANRSMLVVAPNRGRVGVVPFSGAPMPAVMSHHIDLGDGFLLRDGWSILWAGWQWDVVQRPGMVGLRPPRISPEGADRPVVVRFQPNEPRAFQRLSHWPLDPPPGDPELEHTPYPVDFDRQHEAVLTVSETATSSPRPIPRSRWCFGVESDGVVAQDPSHIWLDGGFLPGAVYEVTYPTTECPVVGAGLLAFRDVTAHVRQHSVGAEGREGDPIDPDVVIAFGSSQSGRFLREFLLQGLNVDEAGGPVFDGVLAHVAGAHRGEFNQRYGQPSAQHVPGPGKVPPFLSGRPDQVSAFEEGGSLLGRQRSVGAVPKVFFTNTSNEYWRSHASLTHIDPVGRQDIADPDEVRHYLFAGTQHGPGSIPSGTSTLAGAITANYQNTVDYTPLLRAALVNLARWIEAGIEPPPSEVPRVSDGTAVPREAVLDQIGSLPALAKPGLGELPDLGPIDLGELGYPAVRVGGPYPVLVSAIDPDGNEVAGVKLPDITVPLATHTGWNPRHPVTGAEGQMLDTFGSSLPFSRCKDERERTYDPRSSVAERYSSLSHFVDAVRVAAERLVKKQLLLQMDVDSVVERATRNYTAIMEHSDGHEQAV